MKTTHQTDHERNVLYSVARLQEFYGNAIMHAFFHACDEQEQDIGEAFLHFDSKLRRCLAEYGTAPDFSTMAKAYAKAQGWTYDPPARPVAYTLSEASDDLASPG